MREFYFSLSQNIIFAPGAALRLPELIKALGGSRIMVATGPRVAASRPVAAAIEMLRQSGIAVSVFTDIEANPSLETVDKLAEAYKKAGAQVIAAIGGGSPMDAAKAASIVAKYGGRCRDYAAPGSIPGRGEPVIAVPTTAGTGSEVTSFAVITDHSRQVKISMSSPCMMPDYALLDPELLSTMTARVAAATGADALVHAVESYISLVASPVTEALCEKAIGLIGGAIRSFTANRGDMEAASDMIVGSALAGMAFDKTKLGDVHAMSHPVSAHTGAAHGEANAVLLPVVLEFNALADRGKYARIFELLGEEPGPGFTPYMLPRLIHAALDCLGLPDTLSELGVTPDAALDCAADAMTSGNIPINPRTTTERDIEDMYARAM